MRTRLHFLTSALLVAHLTSQQVAEGYHHHVDRLPPSANSVIKVDQGLVYFDGSDLRLAMPGSPPQSLRHFTTPVFGSFTIDAGTNRVLFAESSTDSLWLIPMTGPRPTQPLAHVTLSYDAVMLNSHLALISARTGGFAASINDLVSLDLITGVTQQVAQIPGASGPLAVASNGDIYYATASTTYPPPPGSASILRFPRALVDQALLTSQVLSTSSATLVLAGLDSVGDLAFDDDGDLFFVDWLQGRVGEVNDADGATPILAAPLLAYGATGTSATTLQFTPATNDGVFEPMQPHNGHLLVQETDYFSFSQLRSIAAERPTLLASQPSPISTGTFQFRIGKGPINGFAILAFDLTVQSAVAQLPVAGFEQPLWWNGSLLGNPVLVAMPLDALGEVALPIHNPGFSPAVPALVQVAMISTSGALGSSNELPLVLAQ